MDENIASNTSFLEEQKLVLTRGFERISCEVIEGLEKELKRSMYLPARITFQESLT
jgi:hypothetical protein